MVTSFIEARRDSTGLLTGLERRLLIWLAQRIPSAINSDHLTALGFLSLVCVGVFYALSATYPSALWAVVIFLALNWFGDSLDGTLARVRGHQRPRYGFYVDHILDTFGAMFVLGGLAISGHMTPTIAAVFLIAYFVLSIEVFLATYCIGKFQMSFWGWGPTELRILLAIGTLMLFVNPIVTIAGMPFPLFDVGGIVGAIGLIVTAIISAIGNIRRLYTAEPLPQKSLSSTPSRRGAGPNDGRKFFLGVPASRR
jgi:archaetidylinositol phosphate synthase